MSTLLLADAKTHLNINVGTYDAELQTFIDAAEGLIADRVGPLAPAAFTVRVRGWSCVLRLPVFPIVSLTSVTPVGGTALDLTQLQISPDATRLVEWLNGGYFTSRWYDVVGTAGRTVSATVNADTYKNGLELVRRMWSGTQRGRVSSQQQPVRPANFAADADELFRDEMVLGAG